MRASSPLEGVSNISMHCFVLKYTNNYRTILNYLQLILHTYSRFIQELVENFPGIIDSTSLCDIQVVP